MTRRKVIATLGVALAAVAAVSAAAGKPLGAGRAVGDPSTDKLAQILARGTVIMATDPAYPPQSYQVKGAKRLAHTKCAANQLTGNQMAGYDADTSKLVAKALGVEPCFVAPTWSSMISGHWGDRWDIAIASIGILSDRMARLFYTQPYAAIPERFFVRKGSRFKTVQQLSGKRLGGCGGCAAQAYIQRTLAMPGQHIRFLVNHPTFVGYDVEANGLADVGRGKLDAFLCSVAVGAKAIKSGVPIRSIGGDQYYGVLSGAVDQFSSLSSTAFVAKVDGIVRGLHRSGTLRRLSRHYFGFDFAAPGARFDIASRHPQVK
jgi:polar amino acid transport system substrate-binding protein